MSTKTTGYLLIVVGVILAFVSLAADLLGIGNRAGIGWQQLLGTAIGVIAVIVGVWFVIRKPNQTK